MPRIVLYSLFLLGLSIQCQPENQVVYLPNSALQQKGAVLDYRGKPLNGTVLEIQSNGDTLYKASYMDGRLHGTEYAWYPHHVIREIRAYNHGQKTGIHYGFWPSGRARFEYHFDRDEYHGLVREWNEKGILFREFQYEHGHESGRQQLFDSNGKLMANYDVINGRRYGYQGTKNCVNTKENERFSDLQSELKK